MTWTDDELSTLIGASSQADRRGCPDPERLGELARAEIADGDRTELVDHMIRCGACSDEMRGLLALRTLAGDAEPDEGRAPTVRPRSRAVWGGLAAVAALVFVAVGVALLVQQRGVVVPPPSMTERGNGAAPGGRVPPDGARLTSAPASLRWTDRGDAFRVMVLDAEGTRLWTSGWLGDPTAVLPPDLIEQLERGGRYYWLVETRLEGERRRSAPAWFEVSR